MKPELKIDDTDLQIISMMLEDAKKPYSEIGKALFISGGTVHVRLRKLIEHGIITGSQLKVDFTKLGYDVIAFVGILLEKSEFYETVINQLRMVDEVISAHYTTGNYSIFMQLLCKDTSHLRDVLAKKIQKIEGIARTETFISLEKSISRPPQVAPKKD